MAHHHWHYLQIWMSRLPGDRWIGAHLYPPVAYEAAREAVQTELDGIYHYRHPDKTGVALTTNWRRGTENPANVVVVPYEVLTVFGCDNECRVVAQSVVDEWAAHLQVKTRALREGNLHGDWSQSYQAMFADPADPAPRRNKKRRR